MDLAEDGGDDGIPDAGGVQYAPAIQFDFEAEDFTAEEEHLLSNLLNQYSEASTRPAVGLVRPNSSAPSDAATITGGSVGVDVGVDVGVEGKIDPNIGVSFGVDEATGTAVSPTDAGSAPDWPAAAEEDDVDDGLAIRDRTGHAQSHATATQGWVWQNSPRFARLTSVQLQHQQHQQQPSSPLAPPTSTQLSVDSNGSSLGSLLSAASTAALDELLDNAVFPAELQVTVPVPDASKSKDTIAAASTATVNHLSVAVEAEQAQSRSGNETLGNQASTDPSLPPLQRWRSHKPLSVTDLVSPAWCELQYCLSLTHHGRKKRTPAMKKGSSVHQKLEDQVHTTVEVMVMSREDAWALRLWNIVQGARTLRNTGSTRELEVWGVIHGQLVNGVIDELSYECPDESLENSKDKEQDDGKQAVLLEKQHSITEFLNSKGSGKGGVDGPKAPSASVIPQEKVYLTDVKTRTVRSLPKGSSFRPTALQLMLYHRMLSGLAAGQLDPDRLWTQYKLDADAPFSDAFTDQFAAENDQALSASAHPDVMDLSEDALTSVTGKPPSASWDRSTSSMSEKTEDSVNDIHSMLRQYGTLRLLWDAMLAELSTAIPDGLGRVLTAEYRTQGDDEEIIGSKSVLLDDATLDAYLGKTLAWWKGERQAEGVVIEEAWKCGSCEFAEDCEWRKAKVADAVRRFRERNPRPSKTSTAK